QSIDPVRSGTAAEVGKRQELTPGRKGLSQRDHVVLQFAHVHDVADRGNRFPSRLTMTSSWDCLSPTGCETIVHVAESVRWIAGRLDCARAAGIIFLPRVRRPWAHS